MIEDGLFHHGDCDKKLKDPSDSKSKAKEYQKSLALVVDELKGRGGYDWLSVEATLMFDDSLSVPPFEAQQLVHVSAYQWSAISGVVNSMLAAQKIDDADDLDDQYLDYLDEHAIYASTDDRAKHALFEACRDYLRDHVNPKLLAEDTLWADVLQVFQRPELSSRAALRTAAEAPGGLAEVLRQSISQAMIAGSKDQKDKVVTLFNGAVTGDKCKVSKETEGVISVQLEGNHPAIVQLCCKGKVLSQTPVWPGQEPLEVSALPFSECVSLLFGLGLQI